MLASTKDRIIDAAINLFSKNGYAETSIRDIAQNVGIKTSSIYYHFESKEAILSYILNMYTECVEEDRHRYKWHEEKDSIIAGNTDISVKNILNYLFFYFDDQHAVQNRKILKIICSEMVRNEAVRNNMHRLIDSGFQFIKSVLDTLLEAEKIPKCSSAKLAGVLYSISFAFMHLDSIEMNYLDNENKDNDMFHYLEYVLQMVIEGRCE